MGLSRLLNRGAGGGCGEGWEGLRPFLEVWAGSIRHTANSAPSPALHRVFILLSWRMMGGYCTMGGMSDFGQIINLMIINDKVYMSSQYGTRNNYMDTCYQPSL